MLNYGSTGMIRSLAGVQEVVRESFFSCRRQDPAAGMRKTVHKRPLKIKVPMISVLLPRPAFPVQTAVLNGFGQVFDTYILRAG
jgi:hypothetical protein